MSQEASEKPAGRETAPLGDDPADQPAPESAPFAVVAGMEAESRWSGRVYRTLPWLVPLLALAAVLVLLAQGLTERGPTITIRFMDGNGLKAGDPVMYRGVRAGEVLGVTIDAASSGGGGGGAGADAGSVLVRARLSSDAAMLGAEGTRFWIVRPEVSLTRIAGLETIVGPRYVEAAPATKPSAATTGAGSSEKERAAKVREFVGLEAPPAQDSGEGPASGELPLVVTTPQAGSLTIGSPVLYRGVRVGRVQRLKLSDSGRLVEVAVMIGREHAHLVRTNTKWWNVSGFGLDIGLLGGLTLRTSSVETLVQGGIAFATPDRPGAQAGAGQVFGLSTEPEKEWLDWSPDLTPAKGPGGKAPGG